MGDCWKSSAQSKGRYVCRTVAIRSGWKMVGRFHGMLYLSAKHSRSLVWWEDSIRKALWRNIQMANNTFWSNDWISSVFTERSDENSSIWQESLTWIVPSDTLCTRREFGRVTYWLQTLRSWKRWTHRKSTRKDSMRKRWYFPKKHENLFFRSQMDESKPLEEIRN